uniref:Uncharacterized protein n=1 Tax=Amphimedon queenslandica TaxID=400682 RepID=A0A1X7SM27_AMPQE
MGCHCDASGKCTLFSLEDSKVNYTCKVNERIHSLDMATNGGHYAVAFASGKTITSPLESFLNATHFLGEDSPCFVNCFTYSHQSSTVACGSIHYGSHEVRLFDIISGVNKESYRGHSGRICSLSFDRGQNNRLISGGEDKK